MKQVLIIVLFSLTTGLSARGQAVEEIYRQSLSMEIRDAAIDHEGFVYVGGRYFENPFLRKLDASGNIIWEKYYPQVQNGWDIDAYFNRIAVGPDSMLYIHMSPTNSSDHNRLIKMNLQGDQIWESEDINGEYTVASENIAVNIVFENPGILITHNSPSNPWRTGGLSYIDYNSGDMLKPTAVFDTIWNPLFQSNYTKNNGDWVFLNGQGIAKVSEEDHQVQLIPTTAHMEALWFRFIGATENHAFINVSDYDESLGNYERWREYILVYDFENHKLDTIALTPSLYSNYDTTSFSIMAIHITENHGVIAAGNLSFQENDTANSLSYFCQINPDNWEITWEDTIPRSVGRNVIVERNDQIYSVGSFLFGGIGMSVVRISPPKLSSSTDFFTSIPQTPDQNIKRQNTILIFPNPTTEQLLVKGISESTGFSFYNSNGQILQSGQISPGETISVSDLPPGVYVLKLDGVESKKVIIK